MSDSVLLIRAVSQ